MKVTKSFQDRQMRYAILIWHEKLYFKHEGVRLLGRMTFWAQKRRKLRAFQKWLGFY